VKGLIDISPALRVGMGVFPGDADFAVSQTFAIGPDCPVNVASFSMSTHCGAHVDALCTTIPPESVSICWISAISSAPPGSSIACGKDPLCGLRRSRPRSTALHRDCF